MALLLFGFRGFGARFLLSGIGPSYFKVRLLLSGIGPSYFRVSVWDCAFWGSGLGLPTLRFGVRRVLLGIAPSCFKNCF